VSIRKRSLSTARARSPEMAVVLKAVRGFPKNCWDSNIDLDMRKGKVKSKKFSPFPAIRICLLDFPGVHPNLSFTPFHCGRLLA